MLRAGSGPAQGRAEDENMASVSTVTTRSKQPAQQPEKAGAAKRRCVPVAVGFVVVVVSRLLLTTTTLGPIRPARAPLPTAHTGPSAT